MCVRLSQYVFSGILLPGVWRNNYFKKTVEEDLKNSRYLIIFCNVQNIEYMTKLLHMIIVLIILDHFLSYDDA